MTIYTPGSHAGVPLDVVGQLNVPDLSWDTDAEAMRDEIIQAMKDFAANDPDGFSTAFDAYSWSGVDDSNDAEFDSIRVLLTSLGFDLEDL